MEVFARQHDLPIVSIAELVTWIKAHGLSSLAMQAAEANPEGAPEPAVPDLAQASLPSAYGGDDLVIHAYQDENGVEHVAW